MLPFLKDVKQNFFIQITCYFSILWSFFHEIKKKGAFFNMHNQIKTNFMSFWKWILEVCTEFSSIFCIALFLIPRLGGGVDQTIRGKLFKKYLFK